MTNQSDTHDPLEWIDEKLAEFQRRDLRRRLGLRGGPQTSRIVLDGRQLINFGSNDYLGLACDGRLTAAVAQVLAAEGWGSGASPLISGRCSIHERLERRLAQFEGTQAALLFPSGFAANSGTVAALVGPGDVVFTDRKNHASLLDGCRLSRADVRLFPHGDWRRLEKLIGRGSHKRRLIVTDSLFSMDGDLAPLAELADLAQRHGCMLLIDEAHATGVFGSGGRGVAEYLDVEDRVHIRVGTLSKALGSAGGYVAGDRRLIDWLANRARPYVFSTAPPAALAAAALAALDVVRDEPHRRRELLDRADSLRRTLGGQGWDVGSSVSQIIPLVVGDARRAVALSQRLRDRGLFVPAIRPPTVPIGEACLRISLCWSHTGEMVDELVAALSG